MSGIAGFIELDGTDATRERLDAMLAAMARRGPDRTGRWHDANAAFGHALLATTPEAQAEPQPWRHPGSGCIVVSDSRLDNRPQLLRDLGIHATPDDTGDGELLHAAWQRWGDACADRLRGDFAFAIWDPRAQRLFAARDPMGVRPFYFHFAAGRRFVFGSSAAAVLAHGQVPDALDENRIADAILVLTEGYDQTSTFYQAIRRLPPAHALTLEKGESRTARYWRPLGHRPTGLPRNDGEWVEAQREQLERAVRLRLRSSHPVGSMLSGGLDSTSIAALGCHLRAAAGEAPFPTFSATNAGNPECIETRMIRSAVAHLRCAPTLVDLAGIPAMADELLRWFGSIEEPFEGNQALAASVYLKAGNAGVRSLLDGVPADNLYAASGLVRRRILQGHWREAWQAARETAAAIGGKRPLLNALKSMAGGLAPAPLRRTMDHMQDRRLQQRLLADSCISPRLSGSTNAGQRILRFKQAMRGFHEWQDDPPAHSVMGAFYITAGLERYNRIASHFGVEPRPPFTDRDLIEFQAHLPPRLRIHHGHFKWPLRKAIEPLLPSEVVWRRQRSHLGWRFNRALLQQARLASGPPSAPPACPWLDPVRLAAIWQAPADDTPEALLVATRFLSWAARQDIQAATISTHSQI